MSVGVSIRCMLNTRYLTPICCRVLVDSYTSGPATGGSYSCDTASWAQTPAGSRFIVAESDFSFVTGNWFWNPGIPHMTAADLWSQFTLKYGQGANLILNVPPNSSGLVPAEYRAVLRQFTAERKATYGSAAALALAAISAPCDGLAVTVDVTGDFDQTVAIEGLASGQVIGGYRIEALRGGAWSTLKLQHGVTVGARVVDWGLGRQSGVEKLRWTCTKALPGTEGKNATLLSFGAYLGASGTPAS